jgi:AcrR family transcriptional regulator
LLLQDVFMPRHVIATRERILNAALRRFSSYGFKRTSMDDIAGEAGVSRAALYLQFHNKEEIFQDLSRSLLDSALERSSRALIGDRPLAGKLIAAVEGMSLGFVESVYASPHGSELLDEKNRLCGEQAATAIRKYREILARLFRQGTQGGEIDLGSRGLNAFTAAELYHRATLGLMGPEVTAERYSSNLRLLTEIFVRGLGKRLRDGHSGSHPLVVRAR